MLPSFPISQLLEYSAPYAIVRRNIALCDFIGNFSEICFHTRDIGRFMDVVACNIPPRERIGASILIQIPPHSGQK